MQGLENGSAVSRRTLARGLAWGVPAVTLAAPAAAVAASYPQLSAIIVTSFNARWNPTAVDGRYRIKSYSGGPSGEPSPSICVKNTVASTTITDVQVWAWYASSGLTFTANSTYSDPCWSRMALDSSMGTKTYNGCTYYAYKTSYTCSVVPVVGTTCLPTYAFESDQSGTSITCDNVYTVPTGPGPAMYFYKTVRATIDTVVREVATGPNGVAKT